ncbi:MAG: hypothetical protein ABSE51_10255 [Terracidiphilus sp.]|jgi:hypothetical protein
MGNTKKNRAVLAFLMFFLAFVLFCMWLVFSSTQPGHRAEAAINHLLPTWFVAINLLLLPCLGALTAGASRIPVSLRFGFGVLMFCSIVISEVSFRRFLLGSYVVLAIVLIEAYLIIPMWNAHHRRVHESRQ